MAMTIEDLLSDPAFADRMEKAQQQLDVGADHSEPPYIPPGVTPPDAGTSDAGTRIREDVLRYLQSPEVEKQPYGPDQTDPALKAALARDALLSRMDRNTARIGNLVSTPLGSTPESIAPTNPIELESSQLMARRRGMEAGTEYAAKQRAAALGLASQAFELQNYLDFVGNPAARAQAISTLAQTQARAEAGGADPTPAAVAAKQRELANVSPAVLARMTTEARGAVEFGGKTAKERAEAAKLAAEAAKLAEEQRLTAWKDYDESMAKYRELAPKYAEQGLPQPSPPTPPPGLRPASAGTGAAPAASASAAPQQSAGKYGLPGFSRDSGAPLPSAQEMENLHAGVHAVDQIQGTQTRATKLVNKMGTYAPAAGAGVTIAGQNIRLPETEETRALKSENDAVRLQMRQYFEKVNPGRGEETYSRQAAALLRDPDHSELASPEGKLAYLQERALSLQRFQKDVESKAAGFGYRRIGGAPAAPAATAPVAATEERPPKPATAPAAANSRWMFNPKAGKWGAVPNAKVTAARAAGYTE